VISEHRKQIFRFLMILVYSQVFAGIQTSLWSHLFGTITPPAFWLMIVIYLALFRNIIDGLVSLFFVSFSLSVYTSLPEGILTLNLLVLFTAARFLKSRVFIPTTIYFAATTALSVLGFYFCHFIFSQFFEENPVTSPEILATLAQGILTFVFSVPVFSLLQMTDYFLRDETKESWNGGSWSRGIE